MKTVKKMAAQGDVMFIRRDKLPTGYKPTTDNVVAHSETGHNHVANGDIMRYTSDADIMRSFIVARGDVTIEHHRSFDTHETLKLLADGEPEVVWEVRRQREYTPFGWRRVED